MERFRTQALPAHFVEHPRQGLEDHGPAVGVARRRAVVQEQDIARAQAPPQPRRDAGPIAGHRVEASAGPGDEGQAGCREHCREPRVLNAGRRAEEARPATT